MREPLCSTFVECESSLQGKGNALPKTSAKAHDRSSEDAIGFALAHRVRVEILSALGEGDFCASELSRLLHIPQSTVQYHVQELLASGSIEVAKTQRARNFDQRFYRAKTTAFFSEEDMATWPFDKLQAFYGLILQNAGAEAMAALHAGTISREPKSWLTWARFNVDRRGWDEMYEVVEDAWHRLREIEADSAERHPDGAGERETFVWAFQGYPRSRPGRSSHPLET